MDLLLTKNEYEIIKILRILKPFQRIEIVKDGKGKPDYYFITLTEKISLTAIAPQNVR